jgi:hypothetical protein
VTPPDYREQAIPADVWNAISRYTNEAASGMPLHEQLEARKERIRVALASWASRIAEERDAALRECVEVMWLPMHRPCVPGCEDEGCRWHLAVSRAEELAGSRVSGEGKG